MFLRKKLNKLIAAVAAVAVFAGSSLPASATWDEYSNPLGSSSIISPGAEQQGSGDQDIVNDTEAYNNPSSSAQTVHLSEEQEDAIAQKKDLMGQFNDIVDQIENTMSTEGDDGTVLKLYGSGDGATSVTNVGYLDVPISDITSIADTAVGFGEILDAAQLAEAGITSGAGGEYVTAPEIEYSQGTSVVVLEPDESGELHVTDAGTNTSLEDVDYENTDDIWGLIENGSDGSLNIFSSFGDLPGVNFTDFGFDIDDYRNGGSAGSLIWVPEVGEYVSLKDYYSGLDGSSIYQLPDTYRTDLVSGGLHDTDNWIERFSMYTSESLSSAMNDYMRLELFDEYAITSVVENQIDVVEYIPNTRKYVIVNYDTGEVYDEIYSSDPTGIIYTWNREGAFAVYKYQEAIYSSSTYVNYVKRQYLADAATGNILWYNEQAATGSVLISSDTYPGWVPIEGEYHYVDNPLSTIDGGEFSSGIERVE